MRSLRVVEKPIHLSPHFDRRSMTKRLGLAARDEATCGRVTTSSVKWLGYQAVDAGVM